MSVNNFWADQRVYGPRMPGETLPAGIVFSENERRWIKLKWAEIRSAQQLADKANANWKRVNDEVNDWLDRTGEHDVVQRNRIKGESLALKDALSVGNWHSRNAERHMQDLLTYLKLKEMELL